MKRKEKYHYLIIIPARKGSVSIPNKNIINVGGKPLIFYSIEHALKIKIKKKIICVSTNSNKIINLCKKYKNIDFLKRPEKYSTHLSRDLDFVNHCLRHYSKKNIYFKNLLILRPTNPIRKLRTTHGAIKFFDKFQKSTSLKTISETKKTPFKTWIFNKKNYIKNTTKLKIKDFFNAPRQILPKTFNQTGTLELIRVKYKKNLKTFSGNKILGYVIDEKESLDIDNNLDIRLFQKIYNELYKNN